MVPVVTKSYPTNGSENIPLNSSITVNFSSELINFSAENILIENLNKNEIVGFEYSLSEDGNTVMIKAKDPLALKDYFLCGNTKYKVTFRNIRSTSPQAYTCILEFSTKAEKKEDLTEKKQDVFNDKLYIIKTNPTNNSKNVLNKYIRIDLSTNINEYSLTEDSVYLINDSVEHIEEAYFFDVELEKVPCSRIIKGKTLLIKPDKDFISNSTYTLVINGLANLLNSIDRYFLEFKTIPSPLYCNYEDIIKTSYFSLLVGEIGNADELIIDNIYTNSIEIENIALEARKNEAIDWDNPPECVKNYTLYKTLYDLVFNKYVATVSSSTSKKLADLEISYSSKASELYKLLDDLKKLYGQAKEEVKNYGENVNHLGIFVKGSNVDEERDFMNRAFVNSDGEKLW